MSGLFQHPQMVEVLGWPLLHFIWQGSLIASLVALGNALLRNARPHSRYLLACLGMVLCLLWPAIDIWQQWKSPATMSLQTALALIESGLAQVDLVFVDESQLAAILQTYLAPLVACWTIGVSIMLCRMALGLLWVRALGQGVADAEQKQLTLQWQLRTDAMRSRLGIRRQVRLLTDTQLRSPVTAGFWQPVIVMPAALLTGLPPHLIDALLAHELAHIKRWDYLVNLVQNLVLSLLFYHPAVWWIARRMDIEREQIADDIASSALTQARDLALALQKLDRLQLSTAMLAQAADGGHLLARIKRLIRPDQQPWRWRMAAPVLGAIIAAIAVAAYQRQSSEQAAHLSAQMATAGRHASLQPAVLTKPHVTALIKTHSQHVLVVDEDSGRILLQKDADARVPIASLSKLMT
ncbi:MAG: M48 family metalloprotease, partial [Burkholderiales bacterium]|nr:M48 family metalloprotease [Burkholderiales bacterium]